MSDATPLPALTPEEREANEARKRALIELIGAQRTVLFAGAGTSAAAGLPHWGKLLRALEDLAHQCGGGFVVDAGVRDDDPLTYADQIQDHILTKTGNLNRYRKLITRLYGAQPQLTRLHHELVALPFRGILTTNFDLVLEAALARMEPGTSFDNRLVVGVDPQPRVREFLECLSDPRSPRRVVHLHGCFTNPESIILSGRDFQRAYGLPQRELTGGGIELRPNPLTQLLSVVIASWRLVFFGFSFTDPYLYAFLRSVAERLWSWGDAIHYAVMDIHPDNAESTKKKAAQWRDQFGLEVVFFERSDNSFRELPALVTEIATRLGRSTRDANNWLDDANRRMAEEMLP